jgi:hypothetical protein
MRMENFSKLFDNYYSRFTPEEISEQNRIRHEKALEGSNRSQVTITTHEE